MQRLSQEMPVQEYYLHALSGARPHDEDAEADMEVGRNSVNRLLTAASLPSKASMETLLSVPAAMYASSHSYHCTRNLPDF